MVSKSPLLCLHDKYCNKDWFHSVGEDQYGRYVIYVKYMNYETLHEIPDRESGVQVLVHFAASKTATREQFVDNGALKPNFSSGVQEAKKNHTNGTEAKFVPYEPIDEDDVTHVEEQKSIQYLQKELDRLERQCGSYTLQDIFYEIQDGKNAVTNMSARYPEIRTRLEKLYEQYGFNVIYEELDG